MNICFREESPFSTCQFITVLLSRQGTSRTGPVTNGQIVSELVSVRAVNMGLTDSEPALLQHGTVFLFNCSYKTKGLD